MTSYDGARRAAALYPNLIRLGRIEITDYDALFRDPVDFLLIVDEMENELDSRRRARDRAVEDLRAIGIDLDE